jgi:hypothetical protein
MKTLKVIALALGITAGAFAQLNTLTSTSLPSAITATQQNFTLASVTNVSVSLSTSTVIYVDKEAMLVLSVGSPSATSVTVQRAINGTGAAGHIAGSVVLAGRPDWFGNGDPAGACTAANVYATPLINQNNGFQWLCSSVTGTWVPGFNNSLRPAGVTAAVASAAGQITPSGPLFHVTGTAAITGFLYPVGTGAGMPNGSFCVIPDAIFTTTTANNIALASTAVVNKTLCFTWDLTNAKWVPSY